MAAKEKKNAKISAEKGVGEETSADFSTVRRTLRHVGSISSYEKEKKESVRGMHHHQQQQQQHRSVPLQTNKQTIIDNAQ